jgi:uncharacterized protein (TIGR03083 family)
MPANTPEMAAFVRTGRDAETERIDMATHIVTPDDLNLAASSMVTTLSPVSEKDWAIPAHGLEWSSRFTLDHTINALANYATHLATRSPVRRPRFRETIDQQPESETLLSVETGAAILAEVCRSATDDARGFHPAGMADWSGFVAMGCTEILIHTDDIARAFDIDFQADEQLCRRVLDRIFPWAPEDGNSWQNLRWACGRTALPDVPALDANWFWHCAPRDDWDGTIVRRN